MKNKIMSAFITVMSLFILTITAMTASAVGEGNNESLNTSSGVQSASNVSSSEDKGSSSKESSSNSNSNASSSNSSNSVSSENASSSHSTSSVESTSSGESSSYTDSSSDSSSKETSSKPHKKPIISDGGKWNGGTFIDESKKNPLNNSSKNEAANNSSYGELISENHEDEKHQDIEDEMFQGNVTSYAAPIYKYVWIPITLSVISAGGLIAANILFYKKYPKAHVGAQRKHHSGKISANLQNDSRTSNHRSAKRKR